MSGIAQSSAIGEIVRLSPAYVQPFASNDVADAVTDVALVAPVNGTIEIAGPERVRLNELIARFLSATKDPRKVIVDKTCALFRRGIGQSISVCRRQPAYRLKSP
jgi:uncharacterized protein YbjT (DUF2867 family)